MGMHVPVWPHVWALLSVCNVFRWAVSHHHAETGFWRQMWNIRTLSLLPL